MTRENKIIQTSIIGIVANVFLVIGKAIIGLLANSISIITDALNNLSDALSSLITIVGTKISNKKPDKKHPYGHGRVEYLTSIVIAAIILFTGGMAIYESIISIIEKRVASYNFASIIVISLAIVVKIAISFYFRSVGKKTNSEPLKASGKDALFDALLSIATIIGIISSMLWGFNLEGYIGILIGVFVLKSGIEILKDSVSLILGERADPEYTNRIKQIINSFEEVKGVYDLIINSYGAGKSIASVHIEVEDTLTARDIHHLARSITTKVYQETGAILTVGIYAQNEANDDIKDIKDYLNNLVTNDSSIKQMHGFYVDEKQKIITFDLVFEFSCKKPNDVVDKIQTTLKEKYPDYTYVVIQDTDFTD